MAADAAPGALCPADRSSAARAVISSRGGGAGADAATAVTPAAAVAVALPFGECSPTGPRHAPAPISEAAAATDATRCTDADDAGAAPLPRVAC